MEKKKLVELLLQRFMIESEKNDRVVSMLIRKENWHIILIRLREAL